MKNMDKQKAIEELANIISDYIDGAIPKYEVDILTLKIIEAGYGNIPQAFAEFADRLKNRVSEFIKNCDAHTKTVVLITLNMVQQEIDETKKSTKH